MKKLQMKPDQLAQLKITSADIDWFEKLNGEFLEKASKAEFRRVDQGPK